MQVNATMKSTRAALVAGLAGLVWAALAGAAGDDETASIREALGRMAPGLEISAVEPTPVPGLYAVLAGPQLVYMSKDGRYMLQGTLIDVEQRKDLSEPRLAKARLDTLNGISEDQMVIFGPDKPEHTVTVFTDIDCGYCRKLHSEIDQYNKLGIRVRYLFFPRAGLGSESYNKAVSVWCSADRKKALTEAKLGKVPEAKTCDNPVEKQMLLGEMLGVRGTPAIVTENGSLLPGYLPPQALQARLVREQ